MSLYQLYLFLRPTFYVLFSMALIWLFLPQPPRSTNEPIVPKETLEQVRATVEAVELPRPELTPAEVVQIQLAGLASENASQGILQCMIFASPANQVVTGPLDRFAEMVRQPPFDVLASPDTVLLGNPVFDRNQVRILVTAVLDSEIHPFVWILSKQTDKPVEDCWMTDAVFPLRLEGIHSEVPAGKPNSI